MFLDEARLAARVAHVNVVSALDVVSSNGEIFIVFEYVHGESVARLMRPEGGAVSPVPAAIASAIVVDVLRGLHAAHEAQGENGERLDIVHRDVSPQNVLVGVDGVTRVLDFGVAKARLRLQTTQDGRVKGKLAYMAPVQARGRRVTPRTDVYAASVVLWELLAGRPLFHAENEAALVEQVLVGLIHPPSRHVAGLPALLDDVVMTGLSTAPDKRFASACEMAHALEAAYKPAPAAEVAAWVRALAGPALAARAKRVEEIQSDQEPTAEAAPEQVRPARAWHRYAAVMSTIAAGALILDLALASSHALRPASAALSPAPSPPGSSAPAEVASLAPPVPPTAESSTAPAPSATIKPALRHSSRAAGSARIDCSPPYTRDADGRVRWKLACL
jgi:serine/threonine-protein kinase